MHTWMCGESKGLKSDFNLRDSEASGQKSVQQISEVSYQVDELWEAKKNKEENNLQLHQLYALIY